MLDLSGRVAFVSSERAELGASAYCGSKAAVRMTTRCWALDLAPFGITVNSVAPGMTDTRLWGAVASRDDDRARLARELPFGRVGQPADTGNLVCWLASDEAAYMTGSYNVMDGGLLDGRGLTFHDIPERLIALRERVRAEGGEQVLASLDAQAEEGARLGRSGGGSTACSSRACSVATSMRATSTRQMHHRTTDAHEQIWSS